MRNKLLGYGSLILASSLLSGCLAGFTVGGNVSGLASTGLTLQNNGADDLPVTSNGAFVFKTKVGTTKDANGNVVSDYAVTVKTQPAGQTCVVAHGTGMAAADVTDIDVQCTTNPLPAPAAVFVTSGNLQATLTWDSAAGATTYNLYWATTPNVDGSSNKIAAVTSPYVHTDLTPGTTYYYRVSAANPATETLSDEVFSHVYAGGEPLGTFTGTGQLTTPRDRQTATLLPNGKVLLAGGVSNNTELSSAELYDPATDLFSATAGGMANRRYGHTATLLKNGNVLIAGGYGYGTTYASTETYEPVSNMFYPGGSMATTRVSHTATLLRDGRVLIVGGSSSGSYHASAEIYDPQTGVFAPTGSMSVSRRDHTATLLADGRVLVAGGQGGTNGMDLHGSAEIYDPATGQFSAAGNMTINRTNHTASLLPNGKVLLAGGYGGTYGSGGTITYLDRTDLFDPATNSFSSTGKLMSARWLHAATSLPNGQVLITGGRSGGAGGISLAIVEIYDPSSGTFAPTGSLLAGRQYHSATLLYDGSILIAGGFAGSSLNTLNSAELFH